MSIAVNIQNVSKEYRIYRNNKELFLNFSILILCYLKHLSMLLPSHIFSLL